MKFLRGLGTVILSLLLFLSLIIFSVSFLLESTLLNPDFITDQVDKVDVSELARDLAEENIAGNIPEEVGFLEDIVYDVIDEYEPWLKERLNTVIYTSYDFLLSKSDTLELAIPLDGLKEDLKDSIWEALNEQISVWLPDIIGDELREYVNRYIRDYAAQIPEKYLPSGITERTEQFLEEYLDEYLLEIEDQIRNQGLTPQISGLLKELVRPYYDHYYDEFVSEIPSVYVLDEENIPAEVMEQLLLARKYIGYFQTGFYALIGIMVFLAALVFLVNWNIMTASRALSIVLLLFGALELIAIFFARNFKPADMLPEEAASLGPWLNTLYNDALGTAQIFAFVVFGIGIILLVVSIVLQRRAAQTEDED